jgi:hypothetical protein
MGFRRLFRHKLTALEPPSLFVSGYGHLERTERVPIMLHVDTGPHTEWIRVIDTAFWCSQSWKAACKCCDNTDPLQLLNVRR